ncbi:hypothetical protein [Enhygromyxa salina]|nr:hypothetical protein [Enhygromyxa salina]
MKATFICELFVIAAGLTIAPACVALELPPPGQDETGESGESGCEPDDEACDPTHDLSGELILFVNARLSGDAYQSHLPLDAEGTYIGNALYLYDPTRECEDGGNSCRLSKVGHLRLDEQLGEISVADKSLRKFVANDLAWHPDQGLWAASFDSLNDEWSITELTVDDWSRTDNLIGLERWVIPPGPAESPSTDPCYWFEAVSGLGFAGDELLLGVRGAGSKGLVTDGSLLRVDLEVLEQGHCVHPSDVSQDPLYYACDVVCEQWCSFGQKLGVAGDVIEDLQGVGASAWLRSEDEAVMALGHNELSSCVAPTPGEVATAVSDNVFIDDVVRGDEIDGLARVGGKLYGLSVYGKVYAIDEVTRVVELIDDLEGLFPDDGLRLRGATEIVVPSTR